MAEINIYGAFRSGTNYVKALLELNYDLWVRTRSGAFKHAPVPALFDDHGWAPRPVIGVVKDPWSWLPSMWDYATGPGDFNVECAGTWSEFLVQPIMVYSGALDGFPRYWYRSPVDYWTAMAVSFQGREVRVVRYEDALQRPEATCDALAVALGAIRSTTELVIPKRRMQRGGDERFDRVEDAVVNQEFDTSYYEQRRFMDRYDPTDIAAVNGLLVSEVIGPLGYSKI